MMRPVFRFSLLLAATLFCGCILNAGEPSELNSGILKDPEPSKRAGVQRNSESTSISNYRRFQVVKNADANLEQSTLLANDSAQLRGDRAVAPSLVSQRTNNISQSDQSSFNISAVSVVQIGWEKKRNASPFSTEALTISGNTKDGRALSGEIYQQLYGEASESLGPDGLNNNASGEDADKIRSSKNSSRKEALANAIALAALAASQNPTSTAQEESQPLSSDVEPEDDKNGGGGDRVGSDPDIVQTGNGEAESIASIDQVGGLGAVSCHCEEADSGLCISVSDASACVEQPAGRAAAEPLDDPEELERLRRMSEVGDVDSNDKSANARLALGLASKVPPESWTLKEFSTVLNTLIGDAATKLGPDQEEALRRALNARSADLFPVFTGISYRQRVESFRIEGFDVDVTYGCIALSRNDLKALVRVPFSGASNQCELL